MKNGMISICIMVSLITGAFGIFGGTTENASALTIPEYDDGYGYDNDTGIMEDTNGFQYSYQTDGIVKMVLPWGYTTYFSFGLIGDYLGVPQVKTALDYVWTWDTVVGEVLNETDNLTGYSYTFTATNDASNLDWTIAFEFNPNTRMKVTHTLENGYANTLENVKFWYLFDLRGTATPYKIETTWGITEGTLYQEIPDGIYWVRLANQFQFNWRDALADYENGYVYVGDGSVISMDGVPILGISLEIGSIASGEVITVDPYFSGIEKTWDAAGDAAASAPASWSPVGVLGVGDNVTFDGTSVTNCDWNVEVTLGNFSMLTGYTGTITQSVEFSVVQFGINSGTFTGNINLWLTVNSGGFYQTGGTISTSVLSLKFNESSIFSSVTTIGRLWVSNNTLEKTGVGSISSRLQVDETATLTLSAITEFRYYAISGSVYINNGIINGGSILTIIMYDADKTTDFGVINAPLVIRLRSIAVASHIWTLPVSTSFGSSLSIISDHATYTMTLDSDNYELSVTGIVTLDDRSIITQGTGAWSFGSYAQTGISSVFNQGTVLTIGGDFTVSDGIFNAVGDMTVPGNWDTATGSYLNDDNVVYLTGASKTLAMNAADSFYNVTVSGSYTMNTDTTVRLRATISGTLAGTGDFIEPEPEFTSTAWLKVCPLTLYDYEVTQTYWDTLSIVDAPYWLDIYDGHIKGIPGENETGLFNISLALVWNDMTVYQNYTLIVCPEEVFVTFEFLMYFAMMLILLVINIVGAVVPQVRILTLFGIFGIAILCVPTALVMIDYGYIALVLILVNIMVPVMSTMNNIKEK